MWTNIVQDSEAARRLHSTRQSGADPDAPLKRK